MGDRAISRINRVSAAYLVPVEIGRIFATFSAFQPVPPIASIPLVIIGLVTPLIRGPWAARQWLGITTAIADALLGLSRPSLVCASCSRVCSPPHVAAVARTR